MDLQALQDVFKAYDIRGKAEEELDSGFARRLGWAYGSYLKFPVGKYVSVGMDNRLSSPMLKEGLIKGLNEAGLNVYDIGVVPAPVLYFSLRKLSVVGGFMITASHNPPDENGFKVAVGKDTLAAEEVEELYSHFLKAENPGNSAAVVDVDVIENYVSRLLEEFNYLSSEDYPVLKVAVDAGNGTAGPLAKRVLTEVGCEVTCLYCKPDGTFPNHQPDPTVPELMKDLSERVSGSGLDLGLGFDGDGDRLGVVDENGKLLWGDRLLYIFADDVLRENPTAKVVGEVKCTGCLFDFVRKRGGEPIVWKAGHSLVKKKMLEEDAVLGGEMSGHFFFRDKYYGYDDALYTALRVVELTKKVKQHGGNFSDLLGGLPELYSTREIRIPCPEKVKFELVEELSKAVRQLEIEGFKKKEIIEIDGIRVNYDRGWALIRPSNTQAVIVVRCEADSKEGLKKLRGKIEHLVKQKIGGSK